MPTTVTSSIGTSGRDYSTPVTWADAAPANLVTDDKVWLGECYNDGVINVGTTAVSMDSTADATRYMHLTAAAGHSYIDHANVLTNALRPNQSNGAYLLVDSGSLVTAAFYITSKYGLVDRLQIVDSRTGNYTSVQGSSANPLPTIRQCLIKSSVPGQVCDNRFLNIVNCGIIVSGNASKAIAGSSGTQGKISSNTIIHTGTSTGRALSDSWSGAYLTCDNTATFNWGADNQTNSSSNNNATNRATFSASSSSDQTSLTISSELESITGGSEDLRAKAAGNLPGNGVRDQTYTNDLDCIDVARSTSTPTIGCWEGAAGGAFTLTADAGSYTLTGTAASLEFGRALSAEAGSYSISGTTASLERGYAVTADAGSYAVSGTDVTLTYGQAFSLTAEAGAYTLTGTAATPLFARAVSAEVGAYTITGTDATLSHDVPGSYELIAEAGSYSISGTDASLELGYKVSAEAGSYGLSGSSATLQATRILTAEAGSYALSGTAATFPRTFLLDAEVGAYSISGASAALSWSGVSGPPAGLRTLTLTGAGI